LLGELLFSRDGRVVVVVEEERLLVFGELKEEVDARRRAEGGVVGGGPAFTTGGGSAGEVEESRLFGLLTAVEAAESLVVVLDTGGGVTRDTFVLSSGTEELLFEAECAVVVDIGKGGSVLVSFASPSLR
jgi:hypothetical protein